MNLTVNIVDHLSEPTFDFCEPVTEEDRQEVDIERTARDVWFNVLQLVKAYPHSSVAREVMMSDMVEADLAKAYERLEWLLSAIKIDAAMRKR